MKYVVPRLLCPGEGVAPFTGAWVEMVPTEFDICVDRVAPFTGAWVEITR